MNGLRYHYQHSGEHGARGLTLLASGLHECLIGKRTTNTSVRQDHHQQQQSQPSMINHNTLPDLSQQNFYQPLQYHPHQQVTSQAQPVQQYNWGMMQS
jgi:transcription factor SFP1